MTSFSLRRYTAADEDAAIELWRRTWQQHYPQIDFNARVEWWRNRWRNELLPVAQIVLAEIEHDPLIPAHAGIQSENHRPDNSGPGSPLSAFALRASADSKRAEARKASVGGSRGRTAKTLAGFVTVDPNTMYLDQIVVAPEHWGSGIALTLLDEAKRISPRGLDLLVNKDNVRAIHFYEKHGFVFAGEDKNPVSGKPVNRMAWRAASA